MPAGRDCAQQWLLIEWPAHEQEPSKYVLSTLPEDTPLNELVGAANQRWRIERDYQDLKQDFGLGHYEGRGWRGFHHHASLCIAAYGFLMTERLIADKPVGGKKNFIARQLPALPEDLHPPRQPCARSGTWITRSRLCDTTSATHCSLASGNAPAAGEQTQSFSCDTVRLGVLRSLRFGHPDHVAPV